MNRLCLACLASLIVLIPARAQTPELQAKTSTALFVKRLQTPDGSFVNEPPDPKENRIPKGTLRATSSAIRALKYLGSDLPRAEDVKKFVASCFHKETGGFADRPGGQPDVFSTAVGLMAVVELGMPAEPYHAAAVKYLNDNARTFDEIRIAVAGLEAVKATAAKKDEWLAEADKLRIPERGDTVDNGHGRALASKLVTQFRLGVPADKQKFQAELGLLKRDQRSNGGWGKDDSPKSDLETTYRVMRCFMMLKERPAHVDALVNFIHKCRNEDHGYAVAPGQNSSISGVYYAAIIMHWLDDKK